MIDRAPVFEPNVAVDRADRALSESQASWDTLCAHKELIKQQLGIGSPDQFVIDEYALTCRVDQLEWAKRAIHVTNRGIHEFGKQLRTTIKKVESEFNAKNTLDIGCGNGTLGMDLERKAKARVTYLDQDEDVMSGIFTRKGLKIVSDAGNLDFRDGEFERTIGMYAALIWTPDPVDCLAKFLEQLRVTQKQGSAFTVPLVNKVLIRQDYWGERDFFKLMGKQDPEAKETVTGMKVWDMQDYLMIEAIQKLVADRHTDMTWTRQGGVGENTGQALESYSALFDIRQTVDKDLITDIIADAEEVAYAKDVSTQRIVEKILDLPTSDLGTIVQDNEVWEGSITGAGFIVSRHNMPGFDDAPMIMLSISGREVAINNIIDKFSRALGEYSSITPGASPKDPVMVCWLLNPDLHNML